MTKIKNTKKGMAKKTLSISLAVAMLATSNVPVWAAEFTDGTDAAFTSEAVVETPVEEVVTDAPVIEEEVADNSKTTGDGDYTDTSTEVNTAKYDVSNVKFTAGAWDAAVSVGGSITKDGKDVDTLSYIWLADGYQAAGNGAVSSKGSKTSLSNIKYTPVKKDFNKELTLVIYEEDAEGATIFKKVINGGKVQPKVLTASFKPEVSNVVYNGKEQKVIPSNADKFEWNVDNNLRIENEQITWNYTTDTNDFTNVTDDNISVVGELKGTYDATSTAYGYKFTSAEGTYKITKKPIGSSNMAFTLKKTSVPYIGTTHTFGLSDVTVYVKMDETTKIDITKAFDSETEFEGTGVAVGKNNTSKINLNNLDVATTDEAKAILNNYSYEQGNAFINADNTYEITTLDLSQCKGEVTREFTVDDWKEKRTVAPKDIQLTAPDGTTFTLTDLMSDVKIITNESGMVENPVKGTISKAITVIYNKDTKNVAKSIDLDVRLVGRSLSDAYAGVTYKGTWKAPLPESKSDYLDSSVGNTEIRVPYIAKAYDLEKSDVFSNFGVYENGVNKPLGTTEYKVSYDDNVNAGIVEVTIKGADDSSYAGSAKKVYFEIEKHNLTSGLNVKNGVTINPENNKDAALYKDALAATIKTELSNGTKVTLEEGKDYTVKYYYATEANLITEDAIKDAAGKNIVGNYVYAVATPVDEGNYTFNTNSKLVACAQIVKKSISNVTVTVEKDSYTFTGKEIVPNVTVKDGSSTLVRGEDYIVKVKDGINVGTATVEIIPTATSDYDKDTKATATFEITPAKAEDVKVVLKGNSSAIEVKENTFKYNKGRQVKPDVETVTLNGVDVTKYFDIAYPVYGENVNAGKDAGSVTIAPVDTTKNFTGTKTQLFDIKGVKLDGELNIYYNDKTEVKVPSGTHTALNKRDELYNFYYDGTAQTFAEETFAAKGTVKVTEGEDYEIKYINNTNAGTAFVAVVAKGNYEGLLNYTPSETGNTGKAWAGYKVEEGKLLKGSTTVATNIVDIVAFVVNPTYFTAKNITVTNGIYAGGKPVKPEVSVVVNGKTLVEGTDYYLTLTSIEGTSDPDDYVDVTTDKPYYVTVNAMGGYKFDNVNGTNKYVWGIDKKDLADCFVSVTKDGDELDLVVMNGNVVEKKEVFDVKDNGDGTATVSVIDGGKSYTGSQTVTIVDPDDTGAVGQAMIKDVKVVGNKATVVLEGDVDSALGYDYVISTTPDYKSDRVAIVKNQLKPVADFTYVQQGTYYAYCHAWKRDAEGKKVFGEWSNLFKFEVESITPSQPVIKKVTRKGNDVTVTYSTSEDATGYDVVLGREMATVAGEKRPVKYDGLVKKNQKTTTVTFKNVPDGTYYVGLHAFNRTAEDGKKVFSPWSQAKRITVK